MTDEKPTVARRTDTMRLDELEKLAAGGDCPGIINDDNGHWAVTGDGIQNVQPGLGPHDTATSFFVEAASWKNALREAIDAYLDDAERTSDE